MTLVVGFLGSPRRSGNSEMLLDEALSGARQQGAEVVKVVLNELSIRPCQGCNECLSSGECVIANGMDEVYGLLERLDGIVISCPIYFSGLTSQTKLMIDRCQCLWARSYYGKKKVGGGKPRGGAFLSVGGDEEAVFRNAVSEIKAFYTGLDIEYRAELLAPGMEKFGEVGHRHELLAKARVIGASLVP